MKNVRHVINLCTIPVARTVDFTTFNYEQSPTGSPAISDVRQGMKVDATGIAQNNIGAQSKDTLHIEPGTYVFTCSMNTPFNDGSSDVAEIWILNDQDNYLSVNYTISGYRQSWSTDNRVIAAWGTSLIDQNVSVSS
jgi:hypothetical protein